MPNAPDPPLKLTLEIWRATKPEEPFGYSLADQAYLLRHGDGEFTSARFPWSEQFEQDLRALEERGPEAGADVAHRLGDVVREFLKNLDWSRHEAAIEAALDAGREVHVAVRCAGAELYRLPLELVRLRKSGETLCMKPRCHLTYEWPGTRSAPAPTALPPKGWRFFLAWSAAGGAVPAAEHQKIVAAECAARGIPFDPAKDVLKHVSLASLVAALEEAQEEGTPIAALHLLCHGGRVPTATTAHGLVWNMGPSSEDAARVDPAALQRNLAPFAGSIRLVVLSVCRGSHVGDEANVLSSVALLLHRIGIPAVVAFRYPLSVPGSIRFAEKLYRSVCAGESLHAATAAARRALATDVHHSDWAGLQVYMRAEDEPHLFPLDRRRPRPVARVFALALALVALVAVGTPRWRAAPVAAPPPPLAATEPPEQQQCYPIKPQRDALIKLICNGSETGWVNSVGNPERLCALPQRLRQCQYLIVIPPAQGGGKVRPRLTLWKQCSSDWEHRQPCDITWNDEDEIHD